jgi:hypothetical protein
MSAPQKDLLPDAAKTAATTALNQATTKSVTLEGQGDGKWTVTVDDAAPAPAVAGGGAGTGGTTT